MLNIDSKISLTYTLGGEYLSQKGRYISAEVYVKFPFQKNEVFRLDKPMKTIQKPEVSKAHVTVTLNEQFVAMALSKPEKAEGMSMNRWLRTPLGQAFLRWKKFKDEEKLEIHIKQYVEDMGGEDYSYEVI